jgi:hypothetical protein
VRSWFNCEKLKPTEKEHIELGFVNACVKYWEALHNMVFLAGYEPSSAWDETQFALVQRATVPRLGRILRNVIDVGCAPGMWIQCECECDPPDVEAWTRAHVWGRLAAIHLCPPFFEGLARNQAVYAEGVFLDELSHYGGATQSDVAPNDPLHDKNVRDLVRWLAKLAPRLLEPPLYELREKYVSPEVG